MSQRDREYDRFGPWAIEISDEDPLPRLFEPHLPRTEAPQLAVKIPRRITRREAHPGMDLYDFVICLYEDDLLALRRVGQEVASDTVAYRDIRHIRVAEDLLRGSIQLGLPNGALELPYNTVSAEIMGRLVGLVRDRYSPPRPAWSPPIEPIPIEGLSFYFGGLLAGIRREGSGMQPLAAQATISLGWQASGRLRRLLLGIVDKRLLESLHLTDGRELHVIDRGQPYAYRWQSVYGKSETWIPIANITAVDWDGGGGPTALVGVSLRTGDHRDHRWVFMPSNPTLERYREFLATAAGVATGVQPPRAANDRVDPTADGRPDRPGRPV